MYTNEYSKNLPPFLQKIKNTPCKHGDINHEVHWFLKDNDITIDKTGSEICEFLNGKSIFITGGTGFLGKLLIEKLFRACIDIDSVFLLVRKKKGKDERTRLSELLSDVVFERLTDMHPEFKNKIRIVHGDTSRPGLGISESDRKLLTDKVNVIFHAAATTRFDEHIATAVAININGTREIIKMARECKDLVSFVHFSTAYSNCTRQHIEEKFYEPLIPPAEIIASVESLPKEKLQEITPSLLKGMPNTYTLTKQIAEYIVQTEANDLPICVFRPAIVICTAKEPLKAWNNSIFGASGFFLGSIIGLIRVSHGNIDNKCDLVPADYVINACIACSYQNTKNRNMNKIPLYNYATQKGNPIRWSYLNNDENYQAKDRIGTTNVIRYPSYCMVQSYLLYTILDILYHKTFAHVIDSIMYAMGKKPRLVNAYKKLDKFLESLSYFTLREFDFDTNNVNSLWDSLNSQDKKAFPFNMNDLEWQLFVGVGMVGSRVYLLKENLDNLEEGRAAVKRAYYFYVAYNILIFGFLFYMVYRMFQSLVF